MRGGADSEAEELEECGGAVWNGEVDMRVGYRVTSGIEGVDPD